MPSAPSRALPASICSAPVCGLERGRIRSIATALVDDLRRNEPAPEKKKNLSDLDLCETRRDRIRAVLTLAFTRTVGDYQAMRLPPELWRVYHVTRPFRLAAKAVAALL